MTDNYVIQEYSEKYEKRWDSFIEKESVNGTFLQSRRFLNYHPKDRFKDCSYIVFDKGGNIVAVCPACEKTENGKKIFLSHGGSTYGGIIFAERVYCAHKVIEIIDALEGTLKGKFDKLVLKITPSVFATEPSDLVEYALYYKGYERFEELNSYIDFSYYDDNILSNFAQGKRTNVNNCLKRGLTVKPLDGETDIRAFYDILCETLSKYERRPVHTLDELLEFKTSRLKDECEFFGAYLDGKMIAGSMMFYFKNASVAHTQYLCATHEYDTLSPMTFMYYAMIKQARENGYSKISFGISTEHDGKEINEGLTKSKEGFGVRHAVNRVYYKDL